MAEAQLLEATAKTSNNGGSQKVSDLRYASLKRYLAKRFHPDYAPGEGIEKIVRNEIFKEIWNEIERLDQGVSATRFATARSSSAAMYSRFSAVVRFSEPPLGTRFRALVDQPCAPTPQSWLRIPGVDPQPGRLSPRPPLSNCQPRRASV